jgi:transposase-like protein
MASYSIQDKIRILKRVLEDGESKSFVAASEGCNRHTIDAWISNFKEHGEEGLKCNRGYSKYPDSLKQEIIQYKREHNSTSVYLSKKFNVPVSTIKQWLRGVVPDSNDEDELNEYCSSAFVAQLIKENQRLRMENDVLKKAEASIPCRKSIATKS